MKENIFRKSLIKMGRAIHPLVLENKDTFQRVAQQIAGLLLILVAAPIFIDKIPIMPNPLNNAELLRHGIDMGLSSSGTIGGVMYILSGLGKI